MKKEERKQRLLETILKEDASAESAKKLKKQFELISEEYDKFRNLLRATGIDSASRGEIQKSIEKFTKSFVPFRDEVRATLKKAGA